MVRYQKKSLIFPMGKGIPVLCGQGRGIVFLVTRQGYIDCCDDRLFLSVVPFSASSLFHTAMRRIVSQSFWNSPLSPLWCYRTGSRSGYCYRKRRIKRSKPIFQGQSIPGKRGHLFPPWQKVELIS